MEREVNRFRATCEDGTTQTVIEYQRFTIFRPVGAAPLECAGARSLRIMDGRLVNPTSDPAVFRIADTNQIMVRDDTIRFATQLEHEEVSHRREGLLDLQPRRARNAKSAGWIIGVLAWGWGSHSEKAPIDQQMELRSWPATSIWK